MTEQLSTGVVERLLNIWRDFSAILLPLTAFAVALILISRLMPGRLRTKGEGTGMLSRAGNALIRAFTTNWQLTLLASTAFVLSLASGWTTWDGMRNFTGEPILSFMVTFGIQGVMLIIAWLIGESFASGMQTRQRKQREDDANSPAVLVAGMVVGWLFALGLLTAIANALGAFDVSRSAAQNGGLSWGQIADKSLYLGVGLLLLATLVINHRSDIAQPYVQSARIMAKNAVLWVMLIATMATSVFFSFDSLFTSIFPQSERKRAAEIRAVNQIAGVVSDIGALIQRRQAEEADHLFQSDGWKAYEKNLVDLTRQSQGVEREIEAYFVQQMEGRRRGIAVQQERIATSQSGQAGLSSKKGTLTDELSRLKGERPTLAAELAEKKTERENRVKQIDAKRVEAMAEERGAEGTLKVGKGPQYRERVGELARMQDAVKIQEERVRDAEKRLGAVDTRVAQIERELAAVDGDIAKLKGEAQTAESRIKVAEQAKDGEEGPKVDPARVRASFERARAEFRQDPTVEKLNALSTQCAQLYGAMAATPATKERVRGIDCDPKQAGESAGRVFALNSGLDSFAKHCSGGDKLPQTSGTDGLLNFGRKCLQDSGLPSRDSSEMSAKMSSIDLNRDDKAHRFVVTWNAFQDGNRLAYLALAIAIAIDSLVFMSGLFGATAIRSPLTDLEGRSDLTADQLEGAIDAALSHTAHPRATLSALMRAMHPIHGSDGFTAEIILDERDGHVEEMRAVLAQGSTIGAVRPANRDRTHYLVSTGLARYFAVAQRKNWKIKSVEVEKKELVNVIGVSLLPDPQGNAEIVLSELHPISDARGFSAEAYPFRIEDQFRQRLVLSTLGAGATIKGAVERDTVDSKRYFVSPDFYKTLLMMRAAAIPQFRTDERAIAAHAQATALRAERQAPRQLQAERQRELPSPPAAPRQDYAAPAQGDTDGPIGQPPRRGHTPPPLPADPQGESFLQRRDEDMPRVARGDARARGNNGDELAASLGSRIRAELIELAALHPWNDREIAIAAAIGENSEPEQALRRLEVRAPSLARLVAEAIGEYRGRVQSAYDQLRAHHAHENVYVDVLETEAGKLTHLMPVLMLSPGGPYQQILERMVYDLEPQAADGSLSPANKLVFAHAKQQIEALKTLPDSRPDRLARVARIIDSYDERFPSHSEIPQDRRTLN